VEKKLMKRYRKHLINDEKGVSQVLESLIAIGISVLLLLIFFITANNIFVAHDKPSIDMEAKCIAIMETLLSSPGQGNEYESNWENNPEKLSSLGLATSPTIAYGSFHMNDKGQITELYKKPFYDSSIGIAKTCFLAGTKIVMADESYKNIEDIIVGDMVLSYDLETGEITDGKVTHVLHHKPGEMGDYYLVINGFLKVTPNHQIYSNGRWVYASELKTGDPLFYPSRDYKVESIEKVYEKMPTYDFEVDVSHCYFVAMDTTDVLVHNPPLYNVPPIAKFTWFDIDGLNSETTIFFDASESYDPDGRIVEYKWDFGDDESTTSDKPTASHTFYDSSMYMVSLTVTDNESANNTYTCAVQANTLSLPDIEQAPWVLTGKNIYSYNNDQTLSPCDENYYVEYKNLGNNNYSFEIKEKNSLYTIIDYDKITNLSKIGYWGAKLILGLNEISNVLYSFNITIISYSGGTTYYYGPTWENANAMVSNSREVLIYHKPEVNKSDITDITPPYYENGKIILRFFIGGPPPNRPPNTPSNPSPVNGTTKVLITADLSWGCSDPDDDLLTYDVYFGNTPNPPRVSRGQPSTIYDPGLLNENEWYYWMIVARDQYGASTAGPVWSFKTTYVSGIHPPPYTPSNPNPAKGSTGVYIDDDLSWDGGDPESGDEVKYDIYFGTNPSPPHIGTARWPGSQRRITYPLGTMEYNTTYYWKIVATDNYDNTEEGPIWRFTTRKNDPFMPNNPSPADDSNVNPLKTTQLSWYGGDPDGPDDTVTYDIYLWNSINPPPPEPIGFIKISGGWYDPITYDLPEPLGYNKTYYWKIIATDTHSNSAESPIWNFTTYDPCMPRNPFPVNESINIDVEVQLEWDGGDPDGPDDTVTYDIYLWNSINPPPSKPIGSILEVPGDEIRQVYRPGSLMQGTIYYWYIKATDSHGLQTVGPIWMFTTTPSDSGGKGIG
jgi:hypothetical protein